MLRTEKQAKKHKWANIIQHVGDQNWNYFHVWLCFFEVLIFILRLQLRLIGLKEFPFPVGNALLRKIRLTITAHAQCQTLLQAAVLAAVAIGPVNKAVPLPGAGVHCIVLLTSPEEALDEWKRKQRSRRGCICISSMFIIKVISWITSKTSQYQNL